MDLPPDLANGVLITLLKNVRRAALPANFPDSLPVANRDRVC